jgi:hypothetical protein
MKLLHRNYTKGEEGTMQLLLEERESLPASVHPPAQGREAGGKANRRETVYTVSLPSPLPCAACMRFAS